MAASDSPVTIYVVDTSSWGKIKDHPARKQIQDCIFELIDAGKIRIPPAVRDEIQDSEFVHPWLHARYEEIVDARIDQDADFLRLVGKVTAAFPGMAGIRIRKTRADPWAVAYAAHWNGVDQSRYHIVVCDETLRRRPNRKMPTACQRFGVESLTLIDMLHREFPHDGWKE